MSATPSRGVRGLAVLGGVVILGAASLVATASDVPPLVRTGMVMLLTVGFMSCVRAWLNVPWPHRRSVGVYAGLLVATVALLVVGYFFR
jgi:hypothetical protein